MDEKHPLFIPYKWVRRIFIAIVGFTVLGVGIFMIVLPGPAFLVIPIGLGILGLEFAWARKWLKEVKERGGAIFESIRRRGKPPPPPPPPTPDSSPMPPPSSAGKSSPQGPPSEP